MNKPLMSFATFAGMLLAPLASLAPVAGHAAPVEYVKICSLFGAGFHYIPGTDVCLNETTGDARQATEGGVWRSLLPYPEGTWVKNPSQDCAANGQIVTVGTFTASDFIPNPYGRKQTRPVTVGLNRDSFVSKVIMSGGFSDPRVPNRHATNGYDGLCVRSVDPDLQENTPNGPINPPYGNGMLPIGCVSNSRIVNMPASYSVSATSAYPSIDSSYLDAGQTSIAGPYTYGRKVVITTDFGSSSAQQLTYFNAQVGSEQPLPGSVTVSLCVHPGAVRR